MENNRKMVIFPHNGALAKNEFQSISTQKGQLLANKIEFAMRQKQYNRQQFANVMGVQPSIVTRWLSGNHNFTVETLFDIEEELGVQLVAIQQPVHKKMTYHMIVGSGQTQLLNDSPFIKALSNIASHVSNNLVIKTTCIRNAADNINFSELFKIQGK